MELRVGLAALTLLPLAMLRGRLPLIARRWKAILVVGALNSAIPFLLYAYAAQRSEEHTSELQSLMRISYAVFCLKTKKARLTHIHKATCTFNNTSYDISSADQNSITQTC